MSDSAATNPDKSADPDSTRGWVARTFTLVEDVMYVGLGALLAAAALILLVTTTTTFVRAVTGGALIGAIVQLLDRLLLTLMLVELLYTIQVSFREHALTAEPFLLVGLVAVIRRILVVTAEFGNLDALTDSIFRTSMIELGVLTAMVVALVGALRMLRGGRPGPLAPRS